VGKGRPLVEPEREMWRVSLSGGDLVFTGLYEVKTGGVEDALPHSTQGIHEEK